MYKYEVIVWWSDLDQRYFAEVPELAGCVADGLTYGQAAENAETIMGEWIETARQTGRPVPEPKGRLVLS